MKTKFLAVLGAALLAITLVAAADAAPRHKMKARSTHARVASTAVVASTSGATGCPGVCGMGSCNMKSASSRTAKAAGQSCPVSDPSVCPSSCPRDRATSAAVASNNR